MDVKIKYEDWLKLICFCSFVAGYLRTDTRAGAQKIVAEADVLKKVKYEPESMS